MLIYLFGSNSIEIKKTKKSIIDKYITSNPDSHEWNLNSYTDSDVDIIMQTINSSPFMASSRLVVVENHKDIAVILEKIKDLPASVNLIVVNSNPDKRLSWHKKIIKDADKLIELNVPDLNSFQGWIRTELSNRNISLAPNLLQIINKRLIPSSSGYGQKIEQWRIELISNQFDILESYSLVEEITPGIIEKIIPDLSEEDNFKFLEKFISKDKDCLSLYNSAIKTTSPEMLFNLIVWQAHSLQLTQDIDSSILEFSLKMKKYTINKNKGVLSKLSKTELEELINNLIDIDIENKSGVTKLSDSLIELISTRSCEPLGHLQPGSLQ